MTVPPAVELPPVVTLPLPPVPDLTDKINKLMSPTTVLHDYQLYGISWLVHMFRMGMPMILGDQMGLGKTVQVLNWMLFKFVNFVGCI